MGMNPIKRPTAKPRAISCGQAGLLKRAYERFVKLRGCPPLAAKPDVASLLQLFPETAGLLSAIG